MALTRGTLLLALLLPLGATAAFAEALALEDGSLGVAMVSTPRCTTAGLGVIQNLTGTNVVSVTVSGLPSGCGGATLQLTVNNLLTSSSGSATIPAGGGSVTVPLALPVAVTSTEEIDLVITGP